MSDFFDGGAPTSVFEVTVRGYRTEKNTESGGQAQELVASAQSGGSHPQSVRRRLGHQGTQELIFAYQAGASTPELASHYGVAKSAILRILHAEGMATRKSGLTPDQVQVAVDLYASGLSLADVGAAFGIVGSTVYRAFVLNGIPIRRRAL